MARTAILLLLLVLAVLLAPALAYSSLSDDSLRRIPRAGADFDIHNAAGLLAPILIPRVPDTPGSARVQRHFADFFARHLPGWTVEWHHVSARTPATGDRRVAFRNLVARRDPPWAAAGDVARLTLAAHYDSLYRPAGFVGATDSAAPCAILLHVARSVDAALTRKWDAMRDAAADALGGDDDKGVQILLFDGEEAWVAWTDEDSTYGSRALAQAWAEQAYPASSVFRRPLDAISLFVLLDLLGAPDPKIPSYFQTTHWAYRNLAKIEERMRRLGLLESSPQTPFLPQGNQPASQFNRGYISDDHIPFMARGVEILHVIPSPFPWFWHKMEDDAEHLDGATMQDWGKLITAFVAEWMELDGLLPPVQHEAAAEGHDRSEL